MNSIHTRMPAGRLALLAALVLALGLLVGGCNASSSYDDHTQQKLTKTDTPLIEAETLKEWMDAGLVNKENDGGENVVILAAGMSEGDAVVPGAYYWPAVVDTRRDGLADAQRSVIDGGTMDEVLQRSGVDRSSTIVITGNRFFGARAYFTLRYWGFAKDKIKLLDGFHDAWKEAGYQLTNQEPAPRHSNYSVRDNLVLNADLHYSIGEMIQAVDANLDSLDATGEQVVNIIRQDADTPALGTSIARPWSLFVNGDGYYATAEELEKVLAEQGVGGFVEGLPTIVHCKTGISAAPLFFALEAILDKDVALYSGSTNQWKAYYARVDEQTTANDAWRTDLYDRSTADYLETVKAVYPNPDGDDYEHDYDADDFPYYDDERLIHSNLNVMYDRVDHPDANQIENADQEYMAGSGVGDDDDDAPAAGGY